VERPLIPHLVKFQKQVRDAKKELRICAVKPEIKILLTDLGAIRATEVKNDLVEALKSFG
jgi:anti-anti-sigma regulatory factor